jgi:hypothetical protein
MVRIVRAVQNVTGEQKGSVMINHELFDHSNGGKNFIKM